MAQGGSTYQKLHCNTKVVSTWMQCCFSGKVGILDNAVWRDEVLIRPRLWCPQFVSSRTEVDDVTSFAALDVVEIT